MEAIRVLTNDPEIMGSLAATIIFCILLAFARKKGFKTPYEKKLKERFRQELEAEQAATQQPQPRQPKPGSVEDFERWKAERERQQKGE